MPAGGTPLLAPGGYVITAQAQVNHLSTNWELDCQVLVGADVIDDVRVAGTSAADRTQIVSHAVVETTDVKLLGWQCTDNDTGVLLASRTISAVAVDDVF